MYVPGSTVGKMKEPSSRDCVVTAAPVVTFRSSAVAPTTTASLESTTTPRTELETFWPSARDPSGPAKSKIKAKILIRPRALIASP